MATDQEIGAHAIQLDIDRVTASRLGIAPTTIDNTLYDAYGQRQINTLYTQLNQYHVILETDPHWQRNPVGPGRYVHPEQRLVGSVRARVRRLRLASSASSAAGSNALTASPQYTPSSGLLTAPSNVLAGVTAQGTANTQNLGRPRPTLFL